ncbi:hypothetical protein RI367_005456 [Sorochytrium milnesiophthora]
MDLRRLPQSVQASVASLGDQLRTLLGDDDGGEVATVLAVSHSLVVALLSILSMGRTYVPLAGSVGGSVGGDSCAIIGQRVSVACVLLDNRSAAASLSQCGRSIRTVAVLNVSPDLTYYAVLFCSSAPPVDRGLAYVAHTSGTTRSDGAGMPVHVPLSSFVAHLQEMRVALGLNAEDQGEKEVEVRQVFAFMTPPTFDPHLIEICLPMTAGHKLRVFPDVQTLSAAIADRADSLAPTILSTTPSRLFLALSADVIHRILSGETSVQQLILGGEAFPFDRLDAILPCEQWHSAVRVANIYGTTECSLRDTGDAIQDMTDRVATGERWLVCGGRYDHQIKRFGCRVQLDHLGHQACSSDLVKDAIAVHHKSLVLLVIWHADPPVVHRLEQQLHDRLPRHYWPDEIVTYPYPRFPLTANGKTDRQRLVRWISEQTVPNDNTLAKVRTLIEQAAPGMQELDHFAAAGGDSLAAARIVNETTAMLAASKDDMQADLFRLLMHAPVLDYLSFVQQQVSRSPTVKRESSPASSATSKRQCSQAGFISPSDTLRVIERGSTLLRSNLLKLLSDQPVLSTADLKKCVDASPLVVYSGQGAHAFVGSHAGWFVSIDLETGKERWRTQLDDRAESTAALSKCGQSLFVGTYAGTLYAISCIDGSVVAQYHDPVAEIKSQPTVDDLGRVWFGAHDGHLYVIELRDGSFHSLAKIHMGKPVFARITLDRTSTYVALLVDRVE